MYIYSRKCRQGDCGEKTPLKDSMGKPLFVGDIVILSSIKDNNEITLTNYLTAIVSDKYTSYSNGEHKTKEDDVEYYVMGIRDVGYVDNDNKDWRVDKLKSYDEIVEGEHWKSYGFNYSNK